MNRLLILLVAVFLAGIWRPALGDDLPGRMLSDVSYGDHPKQRYDVYIPDGAKSAPIFVMVHGGGWSAGGKGINRVVDNKAKHWLGEGFIFISVDYRLVPDADPLQQADDVARALANIQRKAASWGGDPTAIILAGHSSGGHLVDLLGADPARAYAQGASPWRGTLSLDSGAINTVELMGLRHSKLFDTAFGRSEEFWRRASPYDRLTAEATPFLLVCSSPRRYSCEPNRAFAVRALSLGVSAEVLEVTLGHGGINNRLGLPGTYTDAVDAFIRRVLGRNSN